MAEGQKYLIRDAQGNVYGPADGPTLREWVGQGRIVPGMMIAPRETREWVEASVHPETGAAIASRLEALRPGAGPETAAEPGGIPEGGAATDAAAVVSEEMGQVGGGVPGQAIEPVQVEMVAATEILPAEGGAQRVQGRGQSAELTYAEPVRQNVMGILSLVFGGVSVMSACGTCGCVLMLPLSGLAAVTAITLGSIGLWQIHARPVAYTGRGLAIGGICLGSLTLLLYLVIFVLAVANGMISKP